MYAACRSRKIFTTIAVITPLLLAGCGPSSEKVAAASKACEEFVQEKLERDTHVFDTWSKNGNIVVEVGYKKPYSSDKSYSVRLCVVDEKKGTVELPSPLNNSEWKK